jgi:hypothetical protein
VNVHGGESTWPSPNCCHSRGHCQIGG